MEVYHIIMYRDGPGAKLSSMFSVKKIAKQAKIYRKCLKTVSM